MKLSGLENFLNTPSELHALVIGLCEVVCPWHPYFKGMPSTECTDLKLEFHYYMLGRAAGVICWLGLAKLIKLLLFQ